MIDLHSHILSGLDDGASSMEESVRMAAAYDAGDTRLVVATPHFIQGCLESEPELILAGVSQLNNILSDAGSSVRILPGMEIEISLDLPDLFSAGRLLTINQSRYLLIELPFSIVPLWIHQSLYQLSLMGLTPILAHPERNREIAADPLLVHQLVEKGILIQVNAGSLLGCFGGHVKRAAISLVKSGDVHFIASDAHCATGERGPCLDLVRPLLENILGPDGASLLLEKNPEAVINGGPVIRPEPVVTKKGVFDFIKTIFGN